MGYRISREQITYREPITEVRLPTRGQFEDNPYAARTRDGYDTQEKGENFPYRRPKTSIGDYAPPGGTPNSLKDCAGGKTARI